MLLRAELEDEDILIQKVRIDSSKNEKKYIRTSNIKGYACLRIYLSVKTSERAQSQR